MSAKHTPEPLVPEDEYLLPDWNKLSNEQRTKIIDVASYYDDALGADCACETYLAIREMFPRKVERFPLFEKGATNV